MSFKILVPDRDDIFEKLDFSLFKRDNCRIIPVKNGAAAIAMTKEEKPDLVFLEPLLPDMDVGDCYHVLKKEGYVREMPVVLVSQDESYPMSPGRNCDDCIRGTSGSSEFVDVVKKYVSLSERKYERFPASLEVDLVDSGAALRVRSKDISRGGIFLCTDKAFSVGDKLSMKIHSCEGGRIFEAEGRVAHTRAKKLGYMLNGVGVEFLDLGDDERKALDEFLKTL
jgi:uncharacterized protein (TIGR02266 family)